MCRAPSSGQSSPPRRPRSRPPPARPRSRRARRDPRSRTRASPPGALDGELEARGQLRAVAPVVAVGEERLRGGRDFVEPVHQLVGHQGVDEHSEIRQEVGADLLPMVGMWAGPVPESGRDLSHVSPLPGGGAAHAGPRKVALPAGCERETEVKRGVFGEDSSLIHHFAGGHCGTVSAPRSRPVRWRMSRPWTRPLRSLLFVTALLAAAAVGRRAAEHRDDSGSGGGGGGKVTLVATPRLRRPTRRSFPPSRPPRTARA